MEADEQGEAMTKTKVEYAVEWKACRNRRSDPWLRSRILQPTLEHARTGVTNIPHSHKGRIVKITTTERVVK